MEDSAMPSTVQCCPCSRQQSSLLVLIRTRQEIGKVQAGVKKVQGGSSCISLTSQWVQPRCSAATGMHSTTTNDAVASPTTVTLIRPFLLPDPGCAVHSAGGPLGSPHCAQPKTEVFSWRHEALKMKSTVEKAKLLRSVRTLPPGLSLHAWAHILVGWKHQPCPALPCQAGMCCRPPLAASPCCQLLPAALHGALAPHGTAVLLAPHCSPSLGSPGDALAGGDASPPNLVTTCLCSGMTLPRVPWESQRKGSREPEHW